MYDSRVSLHTLWCSSLCGFNGFCKKALEMWPRGIRISAMLDCLKDHTHKKNNSKVQVNLMTVWQWKYHTTLEMSIQTALTNCLTGICSLGCWVSAAANANSFLLTSLLPHSGPWAQLKMLPIISMTWNTVGYYHVISTKHSAEGFNYYVPSW